LRINILETMEEINRFDVIVVGGGASGMMAAGISARAGKKVLILEKNKELGKKLAISGGGRCNITNDESDLRTFLKNYATKNKADQFLFSTFTQFNKDDTFKFFKELGLPIVVEARQRAFPETQKSTDVVKVLEKFLRKHNVTILTGFPVSKVNKEDGIITSVISQNKTFIADSYIFATGGVSHPETGSTGDGFKWLRDLGHEVKEPTPSIVPLAVKEKYIKELSGISLTFMKITFYQDGVKAFNKKGKILFTHFGLSGPLILNSASKVQDLMYNGDVTAKIDMYPDTDIGALDAKIISIFDENKNKMFKNIIADCVPEGMAKSLINIIKINPETKVHSISKTERREFVDLLKGLPVTITGLMGMDRAVVADGGIALNEIDTKTMRSNVISNLFVTGDLLDINRPSGGFSLQLCWTTGYVAGMNA
jgi:predicted Rossmann fold flavoprotein